MRAGAHVRTPCAKRRKPALQGRATGYRFPATLERPRSGPRSERPLVDLFEEIEEQLRSDRYLSLLRRLAPWITGLLALVLLSYFGFWGFKAWQDRNLAAASADYQKGVAALSQGDVAGAKASFQATERAGAPGYKTLALMQLAAASLADGKDADAAKLYDQAAATAPNQILGDLARLRAAQALLDTAPLAQIQTRLKPLADPKRPFSVYAKEALAMAELLAGQTAQARRDFTGVSLSLGAPEDMRQRAQLAIAAIDSGEAPSAIAATKEAATMPPPAPTSLAPPTTAAPAPAGPPSPPAGAAQ